MSETLSPPAQTPPRPPAPASDLSVRRPDRRPKGGAYWLYLIPGGVLFTLIIGIPFVANIYLSFTKWSGIGDPRWVGLKNYTKLLHDDIFWMSFRNTLAMIVAMVVVPTLLGLLLAAVLFDSIGRRFPAPATVVLRAAYYLPQVLPVIAGQVLYFIESNTRSATIIGIVGAGGIGLQLAEQIRVLEWRKVSFLILMILVTVAVIDFISSRLRFAIIGRRAVA
jgi:raffinose/stachyose/melibiose transport system permease protein